MNPISNGHGRLVEVHCCVRSSKLGCMRGLIFILGDGLQGIVLCIPQNLFQEGWPHHGQSIVQLPRGLTRLDRRLDHAQHITCINSICKGDDTEAGPSISLDDGPLNRGCSSMTRQE